MKPIDIVLEVDGKRVPMNPFVRKIFIETIAGMLRALDGIAPDPKEIHISIKEQGQG